MALNPPITNLQGLSVWLVGASSGIGLATAQALHRQGARVAVSSRNAAALQDFVDQHPGSLALPLDVGDVQALHAAAQRVVEAQGRIDLVMYCAGHYRPMRATDFQLCDMLRHQQVNYVGALNLLDAVLPLMTSLRHGHISLVASVAGYRALPLSLAYGPTKAALIHLAEGLYLDLHGMGIGVSLINPGFVDTELTAHNQFRMPALISAQTAARSILNGWRCGRFEVHFPRRFTFWMRLLRHLPQSLYFAAVSRVTGA